MPKRTEEELLARDRAKVKAREDKINARNAREACAGVRRLEREEAMLKTLAGRMEPTATLTELLYIVRDELTTARKAANGAAK